jgi:hypothetical protein
LFGPALRGIGAWNLVLDFFAEKIMKVSALSEEQEKINRRGLRAFPW